jgi:serine/threonine-protein kinase HipA
MRRISVFWTCFKTPIKIGELAEKRGSPIVYEWDKQFLESKIELSPIRFRKQIGLIECPIAPFAGLPGLFADHVPDGWGAILLRRHFENQGLNTDDISQLDRLRYIGSRGMGALTFEPAMIEGNKWAAGEIDLDSLERGIEPILSGTPSNVLDEFLSGGASPNGMRPKIIVREKKGVLYLGGQNVASEDDEWIVKFRAQVDPRDIGKIEYIYSLMAKDAGLRVPAVKLFSTKKGDFFASKLFDRENSKKLHMHTLSGILHANPNNFSIGYDEFLKVTNRLTADIREVEEAFKIAVFNVLACNQDDHSRNVSFLMDSDGKWKVAPAYDLTFHVNQYNQNKMGIKGKGDPSDKDIVEFGIEFGISKKVVGEILDRTKMALRKFKSLAQKYDVSKKEIKRIETAIGEKFGVRKKF